MPVNTYLNLNKNLLLPLPKQQGFIAGIGIHVFIEFLLGEDEVADAAIDEGFSFFDEIEEVLFINILADEDEVDDLSVFSAGEITYEVHLFDIAELFYDVLDNLVDSHIFQDYGVDIGEERMLCIGFVILFVSLDQGLQQPGLLKLIQLHPDRVGRFTKLLFQAPEISLGPAVEKKLQQHLDTGSGCY